MIGRTLKSPACRALGALMAPVLALTLSSCGSSDADPSSANGPTKVRVASAGMIPSSLDLVWAIEGGFFKEHGLDVTMTPPLFATDLANAVLSNDAEFAVLNGTVVASARDAGRPLTVVATNQAPMPLSIAFTDNADKKLRDQGLSESSSVGDLFEALKGMTLGTAPVGSTVTAAYRYLLAEFGIVPEKDNITLQAMPDLASQVAALSNDRVDGLLSATGGASTGAAAQGTGVIWDITKMKDTEALGAIPWQNIVTSETTVGKDPEMIQSFLEALHEAQLALIEGLSPEDAASLKQLLAADMDDQVYDATFSQEVSLFPETFATSDSTWETILEVAEVDSDGPLDAPAADAVNNSFAEKIE